MNKEMSLDVALDIIGTLPRSGTANSMMRSSALPKTIRGTNPQRAPVKAKKQAYPPTTPQAGKNNEHNRL